MENSDWELPKGSAQFGQNAPLSLDDNAAKSLLRRHHKLPERYAVLLPTAITLVETT